MEQRESKRGQEVRQALAVRFGLPQETISKGLVVLITSIHDRLPRGVRVALLSWMPETWALLSKPEPSPYDTGVRGVEAIRERLVHAGVPSEDALPFVAEFVRVVGERCGSPLAEALRRKIPEIGVIERQSMAAVPRIPIQP